MTCVVGIEAQGAVLIGADSAATTGARQIIRTEGKAFSLSDQVVFGLAGSPREQQVIRHRLSLPPLMTLDDVDEWVATIFVDNLRKALKEAGAIDVENQREESSSTFLLGVRDRLYAVWRDFQIERSSVGYHAVGSGSEYALGSLHSTDAGNADRGPRGRLIAALKAASTFDPYVEAPFRFAATRSVEPARRAA